MALLQPQRETYNLFDDVLLLADGEVTAVPMSITSFTSFFTANLPSEPASTLNTRHSYTSRQEVTVELGTVFSINCWILIWDPATCKLLA